MLILMYMNVYEWTVTGFGQHSKRNDAIICLAFWYANQYVTFSPTILHIKFKYVNSITLFVYIDKIKDYFGEKVGLYFYFLFYYVSMLFIPAIMGIFVYAGN